jgi:hypothetical protein
MKTPLPQLRDVALAALATVIAASAHAGEPWLGQITAPTHLALVGHRAGIPDAHGTIEILYKDISGNPIEGALVRLSFNNVTDLQLCGDVVAPGAIVDCPSRSVRTTTNINGKALFTIVGRATGAEPECLGTAPFCQARLYVDGFYIRDLRVAAFDLNGVDGVGAADLAIWLRDFGSSLEPVRSDYNGDGFVGVADLALWLQLFGDEGSREGGTTYCN